VEAIVEVAMKIIEAEGLDAMSMRRVAQALNTGPASLYAHVRNKQDLCELLLEAAFQDLRVPVPNAANWRRQLRAYVLELARVMVEKPGIARIAMETMIPTSPRMLLGMDAMMGILRGAGFPDKYVSHACDALALYSTAYAYETSLWATTAKSQAEAQRRLVEIEALGPVL
jgi:AcrR family transcriptional regulator